MKHNTKITAILIAMFLITQIIGLFVIHFYGISNNELPYGMEPPKECNDGVDNDNDGLVDYPSDTGCSSAQDISESEGYDIKSLLYVLFAFALAIILFFVLTKINAEKFIRVWFFIVTIIAIGLTINAFILYLLKNPSNPHEYISILVLIIAIPLAYFKIFRRNILVHNFTELLIYPGIAVIFVAILNVYSIIILLI